MGFNIWVGYIINKFLFKIDIYIILFFKIIIFVILNFLVWELYNKF